METYKIITFEKDAEGKNVKVERDATPEEIVKIKQEEQNNLDKLKSQIGEEAFALLYGNT
jgi:hypothetical protein